MKKLFSQWWPLPVLFFCYTLFSYLFVDRNLLLFQHETFISWQKWMWSLVDQQSLLVAIVFGLLMSACFFVYLKVLSNISTSSHPKQYFIKVLFFSISSLLLAYPALSSDVFNYVFNAKMVLAYHANPHIQVAQEFSSDPWIMFMRNIHTPAPYGYGWTAISLIPGALYSLGLKPVLLSFRLFMIGSFLALVWLQSKLLNKFLISNYSNSSKLRVWFTNIIKLFFTSTNNKEKKLAKRQKQYYLLAAFALNPLVLVETVGNIHNDVVMMGLLFLAVFILAKIPFFLTLFTKPKFFSLKQLGQLSAKNWLFVVVALLIFGLSVSVKLASGMAGLAIIGFLLFTQASLSLGAWSALAHYVPLFSARSKQYLQWYLIWSLSFLPFVEEKKLRSLLLFASYVAMLSYVPWIYFQEQTDQLLLIRSCILFIPVGIYGLYLFIKSKTVYK